MSLRSFESSSRAKQLAPGIFDRGQERILFGKPQAFILGIRLLLLHQRTAVQALGFLQPLTLKL